MDEFMPHLNPYNKDGCCAVCSNKAVNVCAACEIFTYCSAEHQVADWKNHQNHCVPFKILHDEILGRYAVAVRDLSPGEIILKESPVALGPKHYSPPICLGCLSPILSEKHLRSCTSCGWPICSDECQRLSYHAENECSIFASARVRFLWNPTCVGGGKETESTWIPDNPMLQCITPLRLLLAREREPERWNKEVVPMEAHMKERRDSHRWRSDMVNISGFLRKACRLAERFTDDDIMWACGILQVNAFEARAGHGGTAQCLFPQLAIFSHSCVPNIMHSIDSQFNMVGRVSTAVSRGQPLNTCYTHVLLPTLERREFLSHSKFFDCSCNRCADPTELGTHFSTVLCNNCDDPLRGKIISMNPLDPKSNWKCMGCGEEMSVLSVELLLESLEAKTSGARTRGDSFCPNPDNALELEEALRRCISVLHPNHSLLSCLRISLCELYGNVAKLPLKDFLHIMLEHKVQLCKSIMRVADIIEPGLTRLRGTTLYELFEPLVLLARHELNEGSIGYETYETYIRKATKVLEEAVTILSLEESDTLEAEICCKAQEKLKAIQNTLSNKETIPIKKISQKKKHSQLQIVFEDFKLDLNANGEDLQRARERNESDLREFGNDFKMKSNSSLDLSVTLSDLNKIISDLKQENSGKSLGDLDIFQEMLNSIPEKSECIT